MTHENLSDGEVVELILKAFKEDGRVDAEHLEVECRNGQPHLTGRVASDEELEIINEIINDDLEFQNCENSIWVDDTLAFENIDEETAQSLNLGDDGDDLDTTETFGNDEEEEK